jgi:hypothetical protein
MTFNNCSRKGSSLELVPIPPENRQFISANFSICVLSRNLRSGTGTYGLVKKMTSTVHKGSLVWKSVGSVGKGSSVDSGPVEESLRAVGEQRRSGRDGSSQQVVGEES